MAADRYRAARLPVEAQIPFLEHQGRPLEERLKDAGTCIGVCGGGYQHTIRLPEPVEDVVETVVLVLASAVAADLACEADIAVHEAIVVDVDRLHLDAFLLEPVLHLVQDVAGVP